MYFIIVIMVVAEGAKSPFLYLSYLFIQKGTFLQKKSTLRHMGGEEDDVDMEVV